MVFVHEEDDHVVTDKQRQSTEGMHRLALQKRYMPPAIISIKTECVSSRYESYM